MFLKISVQPKGIVKISISSLVFKQMRFAAILDSNWQI